MKKIISSAIIILFLNAQNGLCAKLSLQEAINIALIQNTDLLITQKNEYIANAEFRKTKGENSFSATTVSNLDINKSESSPYEKSSSNRISGSFPIYTGGKNEASIKNSEISIKSYELQTERQRENLKLNVIQVYYDAIQARETIKIRQEAVDNYEAHYINVDQLYYAGTKARVDVLRASVELSNARYELTSAQNDYELRLATLRNYLNIDRNEPLELTEDFTYKPFSTPLVDCIDYAYNHRKDLLVDLYNLQQKELNIKIAKAGFLPSVNFSMGAGLTGNNSNSWDMKSDMSTSISLNWNIFDMGVTRAQIDAAKAERDIAQLTFNKDKENIDLNIREYYYNMRRAENQLQSITDAIKQAEEDYFIAKEKYRVGEGIMLDVLDAQKSLSESRLNYITAQYDYLRYKAAVENAMGIALTKNELELGYSITSRTLEPIDFKNYINNMEKYIKTAEAK